MDELLAAQRAHNLAQEARQGGKCSIGGEYPFYLPASRGLVPGHIYSPKGMAEFRISRACEFHFDNAFDHEAEPGHPDQELLDELTNGKRHVMYSAFELSLDYDGTVYARGECRDIDEANLVSSELDRQRGTHTIMLDIDHHARLVPSSTPGHFHLFIDVELAWGAYQDLLLALADAGVIQRRYANASIQRGGTHLRMPWVRKDQLVFDDAPVAKGVQDA